MRPFALIILIVALGGMLFWFNRVSKEPTPKTSSDDTVAIQKQETPKITILDPIRGNFDAPITIIEFADYLCENCKNMSPIVNQVLAAYPNTVRFVWKDFPIDSLNPNASLASQAARCAGKQDAYWEYHDLLMSQPMFSMQPSFGNLADTLSLNREKFDECLELKTTAPIVKKDLEEAIALQLDGTPYFFINNKPFSPSSFEDFTNAINQIPQN